MASASCPASSSLKISPMRVPSARSSASTSARTNSFGSAGSPGLTDVPSAPWPARRVGQHSRAPWILDHGHEYRWPPALQLTSVPTAPQHPSCGASIWMTQARACLSFRSLDVVARPQMVIENPILNAPFGAGAPFPFDDKGITDEIVEGRRPSRTSCRSRRRRRRAEQLVFDEWTGDRIEENRLINQIRERVGRWREPAGPA